MDESICRTGLGMPTENRHAGRGQVRDGWEDLGDWD